MFQKLSVTFLLVFFLMAASAAKAADVKIGVVDFKLILENSSVGKKVNADLKKEFKRMESDFEIKKNELEELKKKLEREAMVMSREMREEKEIELRVKFKNAQELEKKYRQELMEQEKNAVNEIQKEVLEILKDVGKKEKYTLISSKIGVLYADDTVDLTDRVIKILNERHKGDK